MKNFGLIILTIISLSSCVTFHSGGVSSGPLLSPTDKYKDIAIGKARAGLFLGIGSITESSLVIEAKKNLYKERPLNKGEYYSNFATDISKKFIFGFLVQTLLVTVSCDVMLVDSTSNFPPFSQNFRRQLSNIKNTDVPDIFLAKFNGGILQKNDTLYFAHVDNDYKKYTVVSTDFYNVTLRLANSDRRLLMVDARNSFYLTNLNTSGFSIDEVVRIEYLNKNKTSEVLKGMVLGVCNDILLISTDKGTYPVNKSYVVKE
jgi:hypothetical protein